MIATTDVSAGSNTGWTLPTLAVAEKQAIKDEEGCVKRVVGQEKWRNVDPRDLTTQFNVFRERNPPERTTFE